MNEEAKKEFGKGNYVSRAVYQRVVEENKQLYADLKAISCGSITAKHLTTSKWRKFFENKNEMDRILREAFSAGPPTLL